MNQDLEKIIKKIEELESRILLLEGGKITKHEKTIVHGGEKSSLRSYLEKASGDVQRTLAIAYHLKKLGGQEIFSASDLEINFEKAQEKKPLNINDKINMNIKNGHMEKSSEKKDNFKAWYVTKDGERFVENDFKSSKVK